MLRGVRQRHLVQRERAQIRQQRLEAVHGQPLGRLLAGGLGLGARRDIVEQQGGALEMPSGEALLDPRLPPQQPVGVTPISWTDEVA